MQENRPAPIEPEAARGPDRGREEWLRLAPLLALPAVPALPGWSSLVVLAGILFLWIRAAPPRRELWLVGCGAALAAGLLLASVSPLRGPERGALDLRSSWEGLWRDLDQVAEQTTARLEEPPGTGSDLLQAFQVLSRLAEETPDATIHLIDPSGEVVAWAGAGLLHDPLSSGTLAEGRTYRASFSAVSLLSVRPLAGGWQVVVGRSFSIDRLPFPAPRQWEGLSIRWAATEPGVATTGQILAVSLPETPTLVVDKSPAETFDSGPGPYPRRLRNWSWWVLGLLLLAVALGAARPLDISGSDLSGPWVQPAVGLTALAGLIAVAVAAGLSPGLVAGLAAALALLLLSSGRRIIPAHPATAASYGVIAATLPMAAAFAIQSAVGPVELAAEVIGTPRVVALRILMLALAVAAFRLIGPTGQQRQPQRRWAWPAVALLLLAAALAGRPVTALAGLAAGGALFGLWRFRAFGGTRFSRAMVVLLVSALAAATSWEIAYRHALRQEIEARILPAMAFPTGRELDQTARRLEEYFERLDLESFTLPGSANLDRQDLAYEIWHHSPLAENAALSALAVFSDGGPVSRFALGLLLNDEGNVDWTPARWPQQDLPWIWQEAVLEGEAELLSGGEPWGWVRYWLSPQPGFRLASEGPESLAAGLLRGGPVAGRLPPAPFVYALYADSGEVLAAPWKEAPQLDRILPAGEARRVDIPGGRAWAYAAAGEDGVRVLFLPVPAFGEALERAGTHALGVLLVLLVAALASLPAVLPGAGLRRTLGGAFSSYSNRLVIVYSSLLILPLLALNAAILQMVEQRLQRGQRAAGMAALESAQSVLGEYVLSLEPGFGFEAALDDQLLIWLSGVVHHEINLYWRSSVLASSKPELFTAGLLPSRIPGEIYSRLTILGHGISSRVNRASEVDYLELYAPLKVPGVPVEQLRLFLSTPLLAQQEEVSAEVASLRRKALLATTLLVLLLVAIGTRLARRFTTPLQEIVRGTQRIAAGEVSLKLKPREAELATLVDAIDRMAEKIAEGRNSLLREKRVVERMMESITAGVVSVDAEGRILLRNRVAGEILGAEIGESLVAALEREESFAPLREFLAGGGDHTRQRTLQLGQPSGEEREWSVVWVPLPGEGEPAALLVVEDVTEVLRGQRLEAWAEMARIIAHEIKNPLTPIRLSAEHMRNVYQSDPSHFDEVLESCTANILEQVQELQQISSEFSNYSRIPRIEPVDGDLAAVIGNIVQGYRAAPPKGVKIEFLAEPAKVAARFDAKLLGRAVRNLLENALRVSRKGGEIRVEVASAAGRTTISVSDSGPGVEPELLPRIFDPYFSTHDTGTGLGLPIARRIAEEHGGRITARNLPQGGLEVTISLGGSST